MSTNKGTIFSKKKVEYGWNLSAEILLLDISHIWLHLAPFRGWTIDMHAARLLDKLQHIIRHAGFRLQDEIVGLLHVS